MAASRTARAADRAVLLAVVLAVMLSLVIVVVYVNTASGTVGRDRLDVGRADHSCVGARRRARAQPRSDGDAGLRG